VRIVLEEPLVEELPPGRRIGRYTVQAPISRGAMGAVYRARDDDGLEVAVKWLVDRRQAARFDIEARLLAALDHPRVVRVLEHFEDEGGQYLVMELVDGTDLAGTLRERGAPGLGVEEALRHAAQACEALQYVHEQQIVHRDVKPQNLIESAAGTVLVDFGVAREVTGAEAGTRAIGTPQYMAPEVLMGEGISPRADVYGLAATVWTLLSGRAPSYHDQTRLAEDVPGVSPELESALRAGLELHPDRRIASAAAFAAALGEPLPTAAGDSLARSAPGASAPRDVLEGIVRTAAGVFEAAAASIALLDATTGELV
jgi:serine/threonine protein kinase